MFLRVESSFWILFSSFRPPVNASPFLGHDRNIGIVSEFGFQFIEFNFQFRSLLLITFVFEEVAAFMRIPVQIKELPLVESVGRK